MAPGFNFGGLTPGEKRSAVMSGAERKQNISTPKGITTIGGYQGGFLDMTGSNSGMGRRDSNPMQLKETAAIMHSKARQPARDEEMLASIEATNQRPMRISAIRSQEQNIANENQQILNDAASGMRADKIAATAVRRAEVRALAQSGVIMANRYKEKALKSARGASFEAATAMATAERQGRASFSGEQRMLGQMFGQGEKIWGTNREPVRINNDLNSSRSDPWDETSSMFGWGDQRERSGMF